MLNIRKQIINFKLQTSYFKENNYLCIRFLENRFLDYSRRGARVVEEARLESV